MYLCRMVELNIVSTRTPPRSDCTSGLVEWIRLPPTNTNSRIAEQRRVESSRMAIGAQSETGCEDANTIERYGAVAVPVV